MHACDHCGAIAVRQIFLDVRASGWLCSNCFMDFGQRSAPAIKKRESIREGLARIGRAEYKLKGQPTEMEKHLAAQATRAAVDDLYQMKRALENG